VTLFGKKTKHIALATIIFVSGLISLSTITNGHNWGGDFAAYIMQAESLLDNSTHDFIKENGFAIKNSNVHFAPISYPWGYPFLLASMIYFMGSNLFAMKLLNIFLYALFLGILFLFLQKRLSSLDTLILVAIFAINPVFLSLHNFIISDIAFLFFSTLTIFLIDHTFPQDKISIRFSGRQIILGFVIFLAFSIRTNGILLLFSLIVYPKEEIFFDLFLILFCFHHFMGTIFPLAARRRKLSLFFFGRSKFNKCPRKYYLLF
jgi:4-amino-4-deoxy-L-arabinose transferase-like glycosyltransferase